MQTSRLPALIVVALALGLAGCGDDTAKVADTLPAVASTVAQTTTTVALATTSPATSSTTTSSSSTTTTTVAPTTVPDTLPTPIDPPSQSVTEAANSLGTIEIPKIGISKNLFEGITIKTLNKGPGHWPGTAMPGHRGNVVVGGHRTSKDKPFRNLDQLAPGDEVIFTTPEGRFVYKVDRTEIVYPDALWIVDQTDSATATLFACHPVGSTKQRIVVFLTLSS